MFLWLDISDGELVKVFCYIHDSDKFGRRYCLHSNLAIGSITTKAIMLTASATARKIHSLSVEIAKIPVRIELPALDSRAPRKKVMARTVAFGATSYVLRCSNAIIIGERT